MIDWRVWMFVFALFVCLLWLPRTRAYELTMHNGEPIRYDHSAITHESDDPELDAMVGSAIREWGRYANISDGGSGRDIVSMWDATMTGRTGSAAVGLWTHQGWQPGDMGCRVRIHPNSPNVYRTVLHEVGHCLGLAHSGDPEAVMGWSGKELNADDRAGILALYPYPPPPTPTAIATRRGYIIAHTPTPVETVTPLPVQTIEAYGVIAPGLARE